MEKQIEEAAKQVKQPNEIEVGNLVIAKLARDEYWANPRNRKTRIVVEILMREMFLSGWNCQAEEALSQQSQQPSSKDLEEIKAEFNKRFPANGLHTMDSVWSFFSKYLSPQSKPVVDTDELTKDNLIHILQKRIADAFSNGFQNNEKRQLKEAIESIRTLVPPGCFSNLTNTEGDKWISVREKLPILPNEDCRIKSVLVFNGTAPEYNQHVFSTTFFKQFMHFTIPKNTLGEVTHWMPLPSPPINK